MADIIEVMKRAALGVIEESKPVNILFGTVISIDPLKINVEQKLTLEAAQLVLARNVTDFKTWLSFDNPAIKQKISIYDKAELEPLPGLITPEDEPHSPRPDDIPPPEIINTTDIVFEMKSYDGGTFPTYHEITIYNHLRVDDEVILIRMQGGQRFIVVDRLGDVL